MRLDNTIGVFGVLAALLGLFVEAFQLFIRKGFTGVPRDLGGIAFFVILTLILLGIASVSLLHHVPGGYLTKILILIIFTVVMPFFSVFAFLDVGILYIPSFVCAIIVVVLTGVRFIGDIAIQPVKG